MIIRIQKRRKINGATMKFDTLQLKVAALVLRKINKGEKLYWDADDLSFLNLEEEEWLQIREVEIYKVKAAIDLAHTLHMLCNNRDNLVD